MFLEVESPSLSWIEISPQEVTIKCIAKCIQIHKKLDCRVCDAYTNKSHQRYYIWFPGYLMVLLASDFYSIFLCCGIALKIELNCKFPTEFCNLRWIQ